MAKPNWLKSTVHGTVFPYTKALAARTNAMPISDEEAKAYFEACKKKDPKLMEKLHTGFTLYPQAETVEMQAPTYEALPVEDSTEAEADSVEDSPEPEPEADDSDDASDILDALEE